MPKEVIPGNRLYKEDYMYNVGLIKPQMVPQKVNFKGLENKYGYQSGQVQNVDFINQVESWEGGSGKGKKIALITALALVAAGIAAHKVPMDKVPGALKPLVEGAKGMTGKVVEFCKGLLGKVKGAADDVKPVVDEVKMLAAPK